MHYPPSQIDLEHALSQLPPTERASRLLSRALHLALPTTEIAHLSVTRSLTGLCYRGTTTEEVGNAAEIAANVAAAGHRPRDRYLDLHDVPSSWVKIVRSGSRRIAFGASTLFGLPEISLEDGVDESLVRTLVESAARGTLTPPHLVEGATTALLDGTSRHWVLRAAISTPEREQTPFDASAAGQHFFRHVHEVFRAERGELVTLRATATMVDVEAVLERGEWEIIVPAVLTNRSRLVGVLPATFDEVDDAGSGPSDCDVVGRSRYEEAAVALHRPTSYHVLLRPLYPDLGAAAS